MPPLMPLTVLVLPFLLIVAALAAWHGTARLWWAWGRWWRAKGW